MIYDFHSKASVIYHLNFNTVFKQCSKDETLTNIVPITSKNSASGEDTVNGRSPVKENVSQEVETKVTAMKAIPVK